MIKISLYLVCKTQNCMCFSTGGGEAFGEKQTSSLYYNDCFRSSFREFTAVAVERVPLYRHFL